MLIFITVKYHHCLRTQETKHKHQRCFSCYAGPPSHTCPSLRFLPSLWIDPVKLTVTWFVLYPQTFKSMVSNYCFKEEFFPHWLLLLLHISLVPQPSETSFLSLLDFPILVISYKRNVTKMNTRTTPWHLDGTNSCHCLPSSLCVSWL